MYMVLFPHQQQGCYVANAGDSTAGQYGFTTVDKAKAAAVVFMRNNTFAANCPILILDLDSLHIVSSVSKVPNPLPWVDRRI